MTLGPGWIGMQLTVQRKGSGAGEKLPGLSHGLKRPRIKASWDASLAVVCFGCPLRNAPTVQPIPEMGRMSQDQRSLQALVYARLWSSNGKT